MAQQQDQGLNLCPCTGVLILNHWAPREEVQAPLVLEPALSSDQLCEFGQRTHSL